jgi:hypothetical protein
MRLSTVTAFGLCLLSGLSEASCTFNGRACKWYGTPLGCGVTSSQIGNTVDGETLISWTKELSLNTLCNGTPDRHPTDWPGVDCCSDYGAGCLTGYKRLWCLPVSHAMFMWQVTTLTHLGT